MQVVQKHWVVVGVPGVVAIPVVVVIGQPLCSHLCIQISLALNGDPIPVVSV